MENRLISTNPLLSDNTLPLFSKIQADHIEPAIEKILSDNRSQIRDLLSQSTKYTWENLIEPIEKLNNNLNCAWSTVVHLNSVMDTAAWRKSYDAALKKVTAYLTELKQDETLYNAFNSIEKNAAVYQLNEAQQKVLRNELRDFKLSGIALNKEHQKLFKKLRQQLSELESQFGHNVLDSTHHWYLEIDEIEKLAGLPQQSINSARSQAQKREKKGWCLTLDNATVDDVLRYVKNREIREKIFVAYQTRASSILLSQEGTPASDPKWDNGPIIEKILKIRQQLAQLLDFKDYAEYSLAVKMVKESNKVIDFLLDLAQRSRKIAEQEIHTLTQFALEEYAIEKVEPWDIKFLSEALCKIRYAISQEEFRAYFPENIVLNGLFTIANKLFGIKIQEAHDFDKWHATVRLFNVWDAENVFRGQFFIDPYHRANKREGAWVMGCRERIRWPNGSLQTPVAYLVTNFAPPETGRPALLKHNDVITLFHEFGHCLHYVLTKMDYSSISGHNGVEWDAIELPSQLLENWCWQQEGIKLISKHFQSGESFPEEKFKQLLALKNFNSGIQLLRQLEFSLFDFKIHMDPKITSETQLQEHLSEIQKSTAVAPILPIQKFQNTFSHIFAGPYAAGYYSYKWAEVLSSDVFETFEEEGIFNPIVGRKLMLEILEQGGAKDFMELFIAFKGRPPKIDALLKNSGLQSKL